MSYIARPNQKSAQQKDTQNIKNLTLFNTHLNKLLNVQLQISTNYQNQLNKLQQRKSHLITLIQNSYKHSNQSIIVKDNTIGQLKQVTLQSPSKINKSKIKSISQLEQNNSKLLFNTKSKINAKQQHENANRLKANQSIIMNRSKIYSKKQTSKQNQKKNYLASMNEYKHKDLVQEISSLMKQLNALIERGVNKNSMMMTKSLLMESKLSFKKQSVVKNLDSQQEFIDHYLSQIGQIQKLPTTNPNQPTDQVINSLLINLQKQQQTLMSKIFEFKNLQIQKVIKQNLQQKTLQNMKKIYNINKKRQSETKNKQQKSTKDIIKFGYTDLMLQCIKQKHNKNR